MKWLIIWIASIVIATYIGKTKGQPIGGLLVGTFFGPLGILITLGSSSKVTDTNVVVKKSDNQTRSTERDVGGFSKVVIFIFLIAAGYLFLSESPSDLSDGDSQNQTSKITSTITPATSSSNGRADIHSEEIEAPAQVVFSVSDTKYKFKLPSGTTAIFRESNPSAEIVAKLDPLHVTHFVVIPTGEMDRESDFSRMGMLKTPRRSIGKRVPSRTQWLKHIINLIEEGDFAEVPFNAESLPERTYSQVFGEDAKIGAHLEFVDVDDFAGYLLGTVSLEIGGRTEVMAGAGAATVVRKNVFQYYEYKKYQNTSDLVVLLKNVKQAIRLFVEENEP